MNAKNKLDVMVIAIGLWLVVSSAFIFGAENTVAMWGGILLGMTVVAFWSWGEATSHPKPPELVNAALGILLFLSPWLLSFSGNNFAAWNAWVCGFALVALEMFAFRGEMMDHTPHMSA